MRKGNKETFKYYKSMFFQLRKYDRLFWMLPFLKLLKKLKTITKMSTTKISMLVQILKYQISNMVIKNHNKGR